MEVWRTGLMSVMLRQAWLGAEVVWLVFKLSLGRT